MSESGSLGKLAKADQIAEMLNVQTSTIYEWARMEYIPHIRLGTGKKKPCIRFSVADIEKWLKDRAEEGRTTRIP